MNDYNLDLLSDVSQKLNLSIYAVERDCFLFEALSFLNNLNKFVYFQYFYFVFAGGTCLSRSYGLIHRMSENVDIKVINFSGFKNGAIRTRISHLNRFLVSYFDGIGFDCVPVFGTYRHRYIKFEVTR